MLDFSTFRVMSFDCYGTLIDWESGILGALRPLLAQHNVRHSDGYILDLYGRLERQIQGERPFANYRMVLRKVVQALADKLGFDATLSEKDALSESLRGWKPFPDSVSALAEFKKRFKLAVISNVDRDLFDRSARLLQTRFDWVITSEEVGDYKPSKANFRYALRTIGVLPTQLLHVAQSLYHDVAPAKELGLATVWVNRQSGGTTPRVAVFPDLEVPDLKSLTRLVAGGA
jgi:2-haloacid dehalogenase